MEKKKEKNQYFVWTYSPKTTVTAHISWVHPDDVDRNEVSLLKPVVDNIIDMEETEFYIYRQLMLEAGYVARYFWVEVTKPPQDHISMELKTNPL